MGRTVNVTESIALSGVSKQFPGTLLPAIHDVSFSVARGEILALLGPSGCGKTTTLRLIAGFERADEGRITVGGAVVDDSRAYVSPEKRGVGMVFQDYALFPHLTVAANIGFGLARWSRRERDARVSELIELAGLAELRNRYPHQLSGGQQQRVALARALAPRPEVLLLDEPFSNLDTELRLQMRNEVRELLKVVGTTAILVTHDQQEAMTVADRMAVMLAGCIEQVDTPDVVYHYPATRAVANFVGQGTFVPATIAGIMAESDIGSFQIDGPPGPDHVDLLLRPRDVTLEVDPDGIAFVQSRSFHGAEFTYRIQLPCGVQLQSNQPSHIDISPGTRVRVRCNRVRLAAYDADSRIALTSASLLPSPLASALAEVTPQD
ncbi:MAG TPA: ABC transporter ATP-binding protein [Thermomicrobiales bacterium]|nr:ABC transporter ATP-binding protein [Thermomicrobiales bacterium]